MSANTYTGPSGALKKDSAWLSSEDFTLPFERVVQVKDVELHRNVKFEAGREEAKVGALRFAEFEKTMVLNATNRKMMRGLFSNDTKEWRGKWVTLYIDPKVRNPAGGAPVCGFRVREAEQPKTEPTRPLDELVAAGDAMSAQGLSAYEKWFKESLTQKERVMLKEKHPAWKQLAEGRTAA